MKEVDINKIDFADIVIEKFWDWWVNYDKYLYKVCKGGRNSGKSTHIPIRWVRDIIKYPINGLIVRKVGNTLSKSCYENFMEATELLGVDHYFKDYKSPLRIVYLPTKQEILFRGADDPNKIKSIKTRKFPIAKLWIEELAEFKEEDEIKVITNSVLRAKLPKGLKYSIDMSYNPPKRKNHWTNKSFNTQFLPSNVYVHHSTYLDNPFVSEDMIQEAEEVKAKNLNKYKWIYLGEAIGGGLVPFSNLFFEKIEDEQIKRFDKIRQGLDFGWKIDPTHFGRLHYDKTRDRLYFLDEIRGVKLRNRLLVDDIKRRKYNDTVIIADSEDGRSISEIRGYGIRIQEAKKGPGSVEYGLEWLDSLNGLYIDHRRTPGTAWEFENIDYKIDKDGELMNELDGEDHSIDMARYAMERDMMRSNWKIG